MNLLQARANHAGTDEADFQPAEKQELLPLGRKSAQSPNLRNAANGMNVSLLRLVVCYFIK